MGAVAAGLFGLVFCPFLLRTENLWIAVGFHPAWDWGHTFYNSGHTGL